MRIILASNSPRRKQLLALFGIPFLVAPANVDETPRPAEDPSAYVARLAAAKAGALAGAARPDEVIIAADTTVADGVEILGKPIDEADAWRMLKQLRGRSHQVFTGVAVMRPADFQARVSVCETQVPMRMYTDAEIEAYIASGDPFDKAGAYAIQHPQFRPVSVLTGCYANVVGLPLCHLAHLLQEAGIHPTGSLPDACQSALTYECSVFSAYLNGEDRV